jgi:hypothetical protein
MLIEAKLQVGHGGCGRWLAKNFDLSDRTAQLYMQWAREHDENRKPLAGSLFELSGGTERRREERQSKQQQDFRRVLRDVSRDDFVQERQVRDDEIRLHREMAEELVDLGYRALAGEMLIEAKLQVGHGGWGRWLAKNFDLSARTASDYMRWAREYDQIGSGAAEVPYQSMRHMTGGTERDRENRQSKQQQDFRRVLRDQGISHREQQS